jgi:hypothetical protein
MEIYPTGLALPNLEPWLAYIVDCTELRERENGGRYFFVKGPSFGVPSVPTLRGMVHHAHMLVTHHRLTDCPAEPVAGLPDRWSYKRHLENVRDFLLGALPRNGRPGERRPCYERDHTFLRWEEEEGLKQAAIRDRWTREHPDQPPGLPHYEPVTR